MADLVDQELQQASPVPRTGRRAAPRPAGRPRAGIWQISFALARLAAEGRGFHDSSIVTPKPATQ